LICSQIWLTWEGCSTTSTKIFMGGKNRPNSPHFEEKKCSNCHF
jgi:hypothetical protein